MNFAGELVKIDLNNPPAQVSLKRCEALGNLRILETRSD